MNGSELDRINATLVRIAEALEALASPIWEEQERKRQQRRREQEKADEQRRLSGDRLLTELPMSDRVVNTLRRMHRDPLWVSDLLEMPARERVQRISSTLGIGPKATREVAETLASEGYIDEPEDFYR